MRTKCNCAEKLQELVESIGKGSSQIKELAEKQDSLFLRTTMANHFVAILMERRVLPEMSEANMKCDCAASRAIREIYDILEDREKDESGKKNNRSIFSVIRRKTKSLLVFT